MKRTLLILCLATALPAAAEDMKPNKDPVPSPSDLAVERPRIDGDRPTSELPNPRSAAAGGTRPILENNRGEPIPAPGR